jgi:hypothetical protein
VVRSTARAEATAWAAKAEASAAGGVLCVVWVGVEMIGTAHVPELDNSGSRDRRDPWDVRSSYE